MGGLDPRPRRGLGSWLWILVGVVLSVAGNILLVRTRPCDSFHLAVQLSGSDQRLADWIPACPPDLAEARASLGWDFLYMAGYVVLGVAILRRWWPLYQAPKLKRAERAVIVLPAVVGALDAVENVLVLAGLGVEDGRFAYPSHLALPITIATISWTKWFAGAISIVTVVMALMLAFARRREERPPDVHHGPAPDTGAATAPSGLGVCCSGGGIRAAAFSLGALDRLEAAGVMSRACWLTAVSGGSYAATAWTLVRAADRSRPAAADIVDWLEAPPRGSPHGRHRFLRNGPGGLGRPVLAAVFYVLFNLVVLAALVYALAWPLGRVIGSNAVQPVLRELGDLPGRLDVPAELWLPGLLVAGVGVLVLGISALPSWRVAAWWRVAALLGVIGLVLEVFLVVTPVAMVAVGNWMRGGTDAARASWVGIAAVAGVAGTIWRLVSKPLVGVVQSRLPELGGVLLVVAGVVWGGKVATDAAINSGVFRSPQAWAAVTVAFILVYAFVGISQLSIHRIYRKRLRRTFGLARDAAGEVEASDDQLTWTDLPAEEPELVLCCAQQRTGIAPGGLPAESFTISPREVRIGDDVVATERYLAALPSDLAAERFVASWTATSGAALASAMGRLSKGSTNALMAATNIDLGIWLPNPRVVADPNTRFPRVRLGYLLKEILGWYDPADRYVFVADGGHWENLGLVELLRRRCRTILCLDASGDGVGAFTTLRQAVELAGLELPDTVVDIDLKGLDAISGGSAAMPGGLVATLTVTYRGAGEETFTGTIHYAKAQVASSLDISLRRYAKADRRFPNYSTGDQFLRDQQFRQLVELGRSAGDELVKLASTDRSP